MVISQCIAPDCSAANPSISNLDPSKFPTEIQEKLKGHRPKAISKSYRECNYCGTVWEQSTEYISDTKSVFHQDIIAIRDLGSDERIWRI